jgi:adenylate cyclase 10
VAETILPLVNESEEYMENKKQEFQWRMAEQKWSLSEDSETKQLVQAREYGLSTMSHKALRSIIVRQIQNRLAKFHNDHSTIIKEGFLGKKSKSAFTWASRYCVMDGKEFKFYYTVKDAQDHQIQPLCTVLLRNINAIVPLNEKDGHHFAFYIACSSWYKRTKEFNERKFYFAARDELTLQQWSIFLEFARAKAIYEEFVNNFGKIQFPIGSPIASFDMAFRNDVYLKKRIMYTNQGGN